MSGSPLLRLALVLAGLALLAIPAWRLTARNVPPVPSRPATGISDLPQETLHLVFTAVSPPEEIRVQFSGTTLATLHPKVLPASAVLPLHIPPTGIDLVISAAWSGTNIAPAHSHALRIQATLGSQPLTDTTLSGDSPIEDVITLPAPPLP